MKKYFNHLKNVEEVKAHYKALAKQHHPDKGGELEVMQEINVQYHEKLKALDGSERYDKATDKHYKYSYVQEVEEKLVQVIDELLKLDLEGVELALIGVWIWATGDTKPIKEDLKRLGFHWNRQRGVWQFNGSGKRSRPSAFGASTIAGRYGYKNIATASRAQDERRNTRKSIK